MASPARLRYVLLTGTLLFGSLAVAAPVDPQPIHVLAVDRVGGRPDLAPAADLLSVELGLHVEVLVTLPATGRGHQLHPEVVGIGPQDVNRLAESDLDLEAVTVEHEHVERMQVGVGCHQEDESAVGMADDDESHEHCDGAPE